MTLKTYQACLAAAAGALAGVLIMWLALTAWGPKKLASPPTPRPELSMPPPPPTFAPSRAISTPLPFVDGVKIAPGETVEFELQFVVPDNGVDDWPAAKRLPPPVSLEWDEVERDEEDAAR